ncbi:MAG: hypothetical protein J6A59_05375 [Lachnospiraceae bacterium]|nr:hypothetical protein [Lachnospiraceae bacterium]
MEQIVKELQELLDKYNLTIDDAVRIYKEHTNKKIKPRKIQHYATGGMWCYFVKDERNPCGCGSNCYHKEYDTDANIIYCVCNACNSEIYTVKDEYTKNDLSKGTWI